MSVRRFDRSDLSKAVMTPQGYLRAPAFATRVGVFRYKKPDGSVRRELRLPEEVFKADSMATLGGVPVTMEHPKEMLDADNTRFSMVGYTAESVEKHEDRFLKTMLTITDSDAIKKIKDGQMEVSCGYMCEHEDSNGTWNGEQYDVIQRNIVYNHLAVVGRGRAGPEVRIRLDAADAIQDDGEESTTKLDGGTMKEKIKIGDQEFECSPELKSAMDAFFASKSAEEEKAKADMCAAKKDAEDAVAAKDAAVKEKDDAVKAKDEVQAKADSATEELEKLKAERKDALGEDEIKKRVDSRMKVLKVALTVLPTDTKFDELTDRELKEKVIVSQSPKAELTGKSDVYVDARFDSVSENLDVDAYKIIGAGKAPRLDGGNPASAKEARNKMLESSMSAWKQPLSSHKQ